LTIDNPATVNVEVVDKGNNRVTNSSLKVSVVTSGSASGGGLVSLMNGFGSIAINDLKAETITLSLSDTQGTALNCTNTAALTFGLGAPTKFVMLPPTSGSVDASIPVTIQLQDKGNNVLTNTSGSVVLAASPSGNVTGTGTVTITNGVGTANLVDHMSETLTLTLNTPSIVGLNVTSSTICYICSRQSI